MIIKLKNTGSLLTAADIRAAESALGVSFPTNYTRFLLEHNGGTPECDYYWFPVTAKPRHALQSIGAFFGCGDVHEESSLVYVARTWRSCARLTDVGWIIVGCDGCGNPILIATRKPDCGRVVFWQLSHQWPDDEPRIFPVAESFTGFLSMLSIPPPVELQ